MSDIETLGSLNPSTPRRCTAHSSRTGAPCKKYAINGANVCGTHGGKAPQTVAKAKRRLEEAALRLATELLGMAESQGGVPPYVKLQAIDSALNRAGVVEPKQVEMTVSTPFDTLYADVATGGSRADYRREMGYPDPEPIPAIEDANRPGGEPSGVRVLASHPDGSAFIIDGDAEDQADDDQAEPAGIDGDRVPDENSQALKQSLTNQRFALPAAGGYLPEDIAMEEAANANRAHRAQLRRR